MDEGTDAREEQARREWIEQAQEAADRVGRALRAAWEASRDERVQALESARHAAGQLGDAIDRGVTAARGHWRDQPEGGEGTSVTDTAPVTEEE